MFSIAASSNHAGISVLPDVVPPFDILKPLL
jgi:hypothetical protein